MERTFQQPTQKPSKNLWQTYPKMINRQLDIKLEHFTKEEIDVVIQKKKKKKEKSNRSQWNTPWTMENKKIWRHTTSIMQCFVLTKHNKEMAKSLYSLLLQERRPRNPYRGTTLSSIAVKVYNALLLNRIQTEIEKSLRKNQNGLQRNRSTISQILTIHLIIEGVYEKVLRKHYCL